MTKPTLYMMLGYPGAGKTFTAQIIADLTGAEHIWADRVRQEMFGHPTFSREESSRLYAELDDLAAKKLQAGKSIVFDTSFSHRADRELMYKIASENYADYQLIWLVTDRDIARNRATHDAASQPTRPLAKILGDMDNESFDRLCDQLEEPGEDEPYMTFDGTKITSDYVREKLGI